ncbi:hypothetical protein ACVU7I_19475, partial [Patulibacter sp. S7RM1-6]
LASRHDVLAPFLRGRYVAWERHGRAWVARARRALGTPRRERLWIEADATHPRVVLHDATVPARRRLRRYVTVADGPLLATSDVRLALRTRVRRGRLEARTAGGQSSTDSSPLLLGADDRLQAVPELARPDFAPRWPRPDGTWVGDQPVDDPDAVDGVRRRPATRTSSGAVRPLLVGGVPLDRGSLAAA